MPYHGERENRTVQLQAGRGGKDVSVETRRLTGRSNVAQEGFRWHLPKSSIFRKLLISNHSSVVCSVSHFFVLSLSVIIQVM